MSIKEYEYEYEWMSEWLAHYYNRFPKELHLLSLPKVIHLNLNDGKNKVTITHQISISCLKERINKVRKMD